MAVSLSKRYQSVTTIAQAFSFKEKPLARLQGDVSGSVKIHLSALARFLNLRQTLSDDHIDFIADTIVTDENYRWLKPADLKIFFDRIKMGRYGDFYGNLNSISFFQCLDKYMLERNAEIERLRVEEKNGHIAGIAPDDKDKAKQTTLSYYVDKKGNIQRTKQWLDAEKKRMAEAEAIAKETERKQNVAAYAKHKKN